MNDGKKNVLSPDQDVCKIESFTETADSYLICCGADTITIAKSSQQLDLEVGAIILIDKASNVERLNTSEQSVIEENVSGVEGVLRGLSCAFIVVFIFYILAFWDKKD